MRASLRPAVSAGGPKMKRKIEKISSSKFIIVGFGFSFHCRSSFNLWCCWLSMPWYLYGICNWIQYPKYWRKHFFGKIFISAWEWCIWQLQCEDKIIGTHFIKIPRQSDIPTIKLRVEVKRNVEMVKYFYFLRHFACRSFRIPFLFNFSQFLTRISDFPEEFFSHPGVCHVCVYCLSEWKIVMHVDLHPLQVSKYAEIIRLLICVSPFSVSLLSLIYYNRLLISTRN